MTICEVCVGAKAELVFTNIFTFKIDGRLCQYCNIEGANLIFQYKKIRRVAVQLQISINIVDKFNFNLCNEFQC